MTSTIAYSILPLFVVSFWLYSTTILLSWVCARYPGRLSQPVDMYTTASDCINTAWRHENGTGYIVNSLLRCIIPTLLVSHSTPTRIPLTTTLWSLYSTPQVGRLVHFHTSPWYLHSPPHPNVPYNLSTCTEGPPKQSRLFFTQFLRKSSLSGLGRLCWSSAYRFFLSVEFLLFYLYVCYYSSLHLPSVACTSEVRPLAVHFQ